MWELRLARNQSAENHVGPPVVALQESQTMLDPGDRGCLEVARLHPLYDV